MAKTNRSKRQTTKKIVCPSGYYELNISRQGGLRGLMPPRKTKLKKGDIIGYDSRRSSKSIKLFRPRKKGYERLHFKERNGSISNTYRWPMSKESLEIIIGLMSASAGYEKITRIPCNDLPITLAYQID